MANTRSANTFYVDTDHSIGGADLSGNVLLLGVILAAGNNTGDSFTLQDAGGAHTTRFYVIIPGPYQTQYIDLSNSPISFPTGIRATLSSNCYMTCIIKDGST